MYFVWFHDFPSCSDCAILRIHSWYGIAYIAKICVLVMANISNQICVGKMFRFRINHAAGHSVANKRRKNYTLCHAK